MKRMKHVAVGLLLAFNAIMAYADGTRGHHGGNSKGQMPMGDHWMAPPHATRTPNPVTADTASIGRGKAIFREHCVACHGVGGRGDGPAAKALSPPPADLVKMAPGHTDGDLAWKIAEGRGAMPPWKGVLSQQQIWDVVNYLKKGLGSKKAEN